MTEIRAGGTTVSLRADGIMYVLAKESRRHTLADSKEVVAAIRKLLPGRRVPLLLNMTVTKALDNDARDNYNTEAPTMLTALAMVTASTVGRIIANFMIGMNEGKFPIKLFNDEASAVAWLNSVGKD